MTAQPLDPAPRLLSKPKAPPARGKPKATIAVSAPVLPPSPAPDQAAVETPKSDVGGELSTSHSGLDNPSANAGVDPLPPAGLPAQPNLGSLGVGEPLEPPPTVTTTLPTLGSSGWLELRVAAEMLYDAQKSRIAASNRAERGGVEPDIYRWYIEQLEALEHGLALSMRRTYRRVVPAEVVQWQKTERGIGEHLLARLLGHLGDPYIATPHAWAETPPDGHVCDAARCGAAKHLVAYTPYVRKVSQLWSYCGVGDPTRKRRAGMTQAEAFGLGSPICKTLIHLLAEACMKQPNGNKYRDIYTAGREKYATREDWKPGRQHNAALRLVKKELLRDLWLARHSAVSHIDNETQDGFADGNPLATTGLKERETQESPAGGGE